MTFWLGLVLYGSAMLCLGALLTLAYVGSLGWERDGVYSINEDTPV